MREPSLHHILTPTGRPPKVQRREAQGLVDRFQRLACFEAVKRKRSATPQGISQWTSLPLADVLRHVKVLQNDAMLVEHGGRFSVAQQRDTH